MLGIDNELNRAVETSCRPCVLLFFFPFFGFHCTLFYLFLYYFKFVYKQLACEELSLLSLEINSGFPQGIQNDNWYQNRAHLNNYICKLQYINVEQNAIRSISQHQQENNSPLRYPPNLCD